MEFLFWDKYHGYGFYVEHLNYEAEEIIWEQIDGIDNVPAEKQSDYMLAVYKRINYYNYLSKLLVSGNPLKKTYFKSVKDFFCYSYPEGKTVFDKCKRIADPESAEEYSDSGLEEHIDYCASKLPKYIGNVLNDNPDDRHWSAVSVNGLIKSYLIVKNQFTDNKKPVDIKQFFIDKGFSVEEYESFEADRLRESAYYRGFQI